MAHQSRFLPSGHPERGDAGNVRAAVANAAMHMEARVREILRLKRSSEEGDETKTDEKKKNGVSVDLPKVKGDAPRRDERVSGREKSSLNPIVA
jgi:hypothetical protein